jgi:hypothetical protein
MEYLLAVLIAFLFFYGWVIDRQSQRVYQIFAKAREAEIKQNLVLLRQIGHIAIGLKRIEGKLRPVAEEAKRLIKYQDSAVALGMVSDLLERLGGGTTNKSEETMNSDKSL